jgi:hypothetical protein
MKGKNFLQEDQECCGKVKKQVGKEEVVLVLLQPCVDSSDKDCLDDL